MGNRFSHSLVSGSVSCISSIIFTPIFCNLCYTLLTHTVRKDSINISSPQVVISGLEYLRSSQRCCLLYSESTTQTAKESEWPALPRLGSQSSPSCCFASGTQLPSSCLTPRSSGSCWAATRRKQTITAPTTQLAAGSDEPSAGPIERRSSSCTTSWGQAFTPLPQTWSTWWDMSHCHSYYS